MSYLRGIGQTMLMQGTTTTRALSPLEKKMAAIKRLATKKKRKKKKRRKSPVLEVAPTYAGPTRAQREPMTIRKTRTKPPVKEVLPDYKPPAAKQEPPTPMTPAKPPSAEDLPAFAETQKVDTVEPPKSTKPPGERIVYAGGGGAPAYKPPGRAVPSVSFSPTAPFEPTFAEEKKPFPWLWVGIGGAVIAAWMVLK